jgi:hypothetical protein
MCTSLSQAVLQLGFYIPRNVSDEEMAVTIIAGS